jgi:transcriptional regulator with XRE-family HTH domain
MSLPSPQIFGARLRRERESLGLSSGQVAIKAGLTSGRAVTTAERAVHQPGIFTVARIAAALGVSLDTLMADPDCPGCDGYPPPGRSCPQCKTTGLL